MNYTDRDADLSYELASAEETTGRFTSLLVGMTLEPGMFCTMALREVMGATTHPSDQFRLRLQLEAVSDGPPRRDEQMHQSDAGAIKLGCL